MANTTNSYTVQPWALQFLFFFFLSEIVIMQNVKEQALATYTIRELFFFGYANVCRR